MAAITDSKSVSDDSSSAEGRSGSSRFHRWLRSLVGLKSDEHALRQAFEEWIDEQGEDEPGRAMAEEERVILRNVLTFGELTVDDVMTPQSDIEAIAEDVDLDTLCGRFRDNRHTRMPVYGENIDDIKGFLHVKDMLPLIGSGDTTYDMAALMRPVLFVPPSMRIVDLLVKMRSTGTHMAIVVDEYGGTMGLVTLEDVFEEIVGEIQDEHDEASDVPTPLEWDDRQAVVVDAKERIDRLEDELNLQLTTEEEEETYDTLGGLIFSQLGRVPTRGETLLYGEHVRLEVLDADARRIKRVRICRVESQPSETSAA